MKHIFQLALLIALATSPTFAQFTTVSGAVTDPNGLPYSFGTIASTIVSSGTPLFSSNSQPYFQPTQATGLDKNGSFIVRLADNTLISPGGSTWTFTVCSAVGTVQPAFGKGPVCFTVTGVSISGASQDIGATLHAAAPALTVNFGGGGTISGSGTTGFIPVFTSSTALGNSSLSATANQIIFGSGTPLAGSIGVLSQVSETTASCGGSNVIPLGTTNIGCAGIKQVFNTNSGTNTGVNAGLFVAAQGSNFVAGTLGIGIYGVEDASFNLTEARGGYFEAFESSGTPTVTTRRGLMAFAANGTGNTTATNEGFVAESGSSSGTNTNDFTMHCLAPLGGGTLTTHACIKVDAQGTGVEMQVGAHTFAGLPACTATYEGSFAAVTDATSATNGATVVGSGAHHVLAYCNSVNWLVVVGT